MRPNSSIQNPKSKIQNSHFPSGPVWLIANPAAGGHRTRRHLDRAIALLHSRRAIAEIRWTQKRGDAEEWAREAAAANVALVIGYGGDGTLNEIANGLGDSRAVLGILPAGTGNVVASELSIPRDPIAAAECLLAGQVERLTLGRAEFIPLDSGLQPPAASLQTPNSKLGTRHFLFAASVGFDALVCHDITVPLKRWIGRAVYVYDGLRLLVRYQSPHMQVTLDGGAPIQSSYLVISNGRFYGGRFLMAPDASLFQPELDACLFTRHGRWNLLRYAFAVLRSKHVTLRDVAHRKVHSLEVTADRPVFLQLDGDTVGTTPARFSVLPQAIAVITPARM